MKVTNHNNVLRPDISPEVREIDLVPKHFKIGRIYHLSWARDRAMTWVLKKIIGTTAYLETPKTKKELISHIDTIRCSNVEALINLNQRKRNLTILK